MPLSIGSKAPDFLLPNANSKLISLDKDFKGKACVVFFYPKNFSRVCTIEVCEFAEKYDAFVAKGLSLIGISTDSSSSHFRFIKQNNLPFELLSDTSGKVSDLYGAKLPFIKMANRITFLLDQNHTIRAIHQGLFHGEDHVKVMLRQLDLVK